MLNLSDKELDRLSREAASQYDPGDPLGTGSWDRLAPRLDKELGRVTPNPNPLRGIRRLPFQYAPVLILIVGVTAYFVRQARIRKAEPSGSPPMTIVKSIKPDQTQSPTAKAPDNRINSTPQSEPQITPANVNPSQTDGQSGGNNNAVPYMAHDASHPTAPPGNSTASSGHAGSGTPVSGISSTVPASTGNSPGSINNSSASAGNAPASTGNAPASISNAPASPGNRHATGNAPTGNAPASPANGNIINNVPASINNSLASNHNKIGSSVLNSNKSVAAGNNNKSGRKAYNSLTNSGAPVTGTQSAGIQSADNKSTARTLGYASIQSPQSLTTRQIKISDAKLRAYKATAATPVSPGKKNQSGGGSFIDRRLQIGLRFSPEFSSVNSLAGDKPGSSWGLTLDYQLIDHFYISSGLLLTKKIYSARLQDCTLPPDYFGAVGLHNVDFTKGNLKMLEIPLMFRYDFTSAANTRIYATAGFSNYILTSQRTDYYFNMFGREAFKSFHYPDKQFYPFAALDLSLGVEAGLSNSLSVTVAPYVKMPTSNMGFGNIRINSVGIDVGIKYAPVLGRKRK